MTTVVDIPVVHEDPTADLPQYQTPGASAMDVAAYLPGNSPLVVPAGEHRLVSTGLKVAIPEGYEILVCPRSGLALKKQVTVLNSPGTIDSDYRGVLGVVVQNHSKEYFVIEHNDRIAQIKLMPTLRINWTRVDDLDATQRGDGGFGHTGTN